KLPWHSKLTLGLVTLSENGCKIYTPKPSVDLLIFSCQHTSVDTTGARDSYVGALLCNIVDDRTVPALTYGNMGNCHGSIGSKKDEARLGEVLRFANACGSITTTILPRKELFRLFLRCLRFRLS
ncbi:hypothetical protein HID58_060595, partial [Brassica napus]